jgi:hypothetical protein
MLWATVSHEAEFLKLKPKYSLETRVYSLEQLLHFRNRTYTYAHACKQRNNVIQTLIPFPSPSYFPSTSLQGASNPISSGCSLPAATAPAPLLPRSCLLSLETCNAVCHHAFLCIRPCSPSLPYTATFSSFLPYSLSFWSLLSLPIIAVPENYEMSKRPSSRLMLTDRRSRFSKNN